MLRLSTKGRYGLHAMLDLALYYGQRPVSLKGISERQGISAPYLEQLFAQLRRAELVRSVRGAQGGYMLERPPGQITVGEVLRAMEGRMTLALCMDEGSYDECRHQGCCAVQTIWEKVTEQFDRVIDGITLADALKMQEDMTGDSRLLGACRPASSDDISEEAIR